MSTLKKLLKSIEDSGLTDYEVMIEAKVSHSTLVNWRRKEPKSFILKDRIEAAIVELSKEKQNDNTTN